MAVTVTERPHKFSFSENEIRYMFTLTQFDEPGTALEIELYTKPANGSYSLLTVFFLYPDNTGRIVGHFNNILKSVLSPTLPNLAGNIEQPATSQQKHFYIRYRQISNATPTPAWISDIANEKIVLLGGVEQMRFKRNNFFTSFLPANKTFMTWKPGNSFIFLDQQAFLTIFFPNPAIGTFSLTATVLYTDGTQHGKDLHFSIAAGTHLYHLQTGVSALELDDLLPLKKIYAYDITVLGGGNVLAEYRYYIDYRPLYSYYELTYFNSIGGWDTTRIKGEVAWEVESEADNIEHIVFDDLYTSLVPQAQFTQANIVKKDVYSGDAGYLNTPDQQAGLVELMLSKAIYEWNDDRWIRVMNLKRKQLVRKSTDKKWSFPVEWSYGYKDAVFTPKNISLGPGTAN